MMLDLPETNFHVVDECSSPFQEQDTELHG